MESIQNLLDTKSLYHAYGISGLSSTNLVTELEKIFDITNTGDYLFNKTYSTFKIEDAWEIKSLQSERASEDKKRLFILQAEFMTVEAQNALLKVFEEPSRNTHFFILMPNISELLPTLVSRLQILNIETVADEETKNLAQEFLGMSVKERLDLVKKNTDKKLDGDEQFDRSRTLALIAEIERALFAGKKNIDSKELEFIFKEIFMMKKFLNRNAPSPKMILDHLSVILPRLS